LFVDESLYVWRFLEVHAAASFYTNRKDEASSTFKELLEITKKSPQHFTPEDLAED
jgi:hypothetical protein